MEGILEISLDKDVRLIQSELQNAVKLPEAIDLEKLADNFEESIKNLLGEPPPSSIGGHPAKRSGDLQRSVRAEVAGSNEIDITMIYYAGFQDPDLGGQLGRPFAFEGLEIGLKKSISDYESSGSAL